MHYPHSKWRIYSSLSLFVVVVVVVVVQKRLGKDFQGRCFVINHNFITQFQIMRQMRSINKDASLLRIPSNMHLFTMLHEAIVESMNAIVVVVVVRMG